MTGFFEWIFRLGNKSGNSILRAKMDSEIDVSENSVLHYSIYQKVDVIIEK